MAVVARNYKGYTVFPSGDIVGPSGRVLKPVPNNCGYGRVTICHDGRKELKFAHRVVAEMFIPPVDGKPYVNHKDGDKTNNAAENLEWVNCSENHKHAFDRGRKSSNPNKNGKCSGEKNAMSKLTGDDIPKMLDMQRLGASQREIAKAFDVNQALVWRVLNNKAWRHVCR